MQHHRRSIRLRGHDYSQSGFYFITVCTAQRECLFGNIVDGEMVLNEYGQMVRDEWAKTASIRREITLDEYVIMPNHFHGILVIADGRGDRPVARTKTNSVAGTKPQSGPMPRSIGAFVAGFKSAVTQRINTKRQTPRQPVWQRNYYEHIIRNDAELNNIREYIRNNPAQWELDDLYRS